MSHSSTEATPDLAGDAGARLRDEWECQQVVLWFTAHLDASEYEEMERYFTSDGIWHQARGPVRGHQELRERLRSFDPDRIWRHVLTNLRTTILDREHAVVDSYFTVYIQQRGGDRTTPVVTPGPRHVGRFRDRLRRVDNTWLLAERQVIFDLKIQGESGPTV